MRNIRRKAVDLKALRLSAEEGFVLSRLDASMSLKELVAITGLDEGRVTEIVDVLYTQGAIDVDRDATPAQAASPLVSDAAAGGSLPPSPEPALEAEEIDEEEEQRVAGEREYRKIYEVVFQEMPREQRIAAAQTEDGANLYALCHDPEPQVVHAVLSNPQVGLAHARMIALYHRTHVGLDMLGRRAEFLADSAVQRRLLSNPQLPDALLRRIVNPKLLTEIYKIAINREIPEMTRVKTREILIKKFMLAGSDERAALIVKTDARCLVLLVNCALDARATQILCGRTAYTVLFIQNVARWPASPPALLTHLLKQPLVRQSVGLRKMLLKHPNVPYETKRNLT